jgi:hypothetical protein
MLELLEVDTEAVLHWLSAGPTRRFHILRYLQYLLSAVDIHANLTQIRFLQKALKISQNLMQLLLRR